jgi:hypothetical protein
MNTQQITIHVDAVAAQAFLSASDEERRNLEALLSLQLLAATRTHAPLVGIMDEISQKVQERGLTAEELEPILNEG